MAVIYTVLGWWLRGHICDSEPFPGAVTEPLRYVKLGS